jgi:hypothetical protein
MERMLSGVQDLCYDAVETFCQAILIQAEFLKLVIQAQVEYNTDMYRKNKWQARAQHRILILCEKCIEIMANLGELIADQPFSQKLTMPFAYIQVIMYSYMITHCGSICILLLFL